MKRKQLSGKRIGIVFGTFAPMHVGHVDLITKAKRANDNVLVIVSGSNTQEDRVDTRRPITQSTFPLCSRSLL